MKEKNPLVSIIIVNYNGKKFLHKCLKSIIHNNYSNFEIIFVDNSSTDNSVKLACDLFPDIKLIQLEKNQGFARPNNMGAKKAQGDFLFFLNNDTAIEPNSINELVKAMYDSCIDISQSLLLKPDKKIDSSGDYFSTNGFAYSDYKINNSIKEILSPKGAAMMIKKEIFWKLGGFDEKFFASFEDVDLGWRAWLLGYKVCLVPNSIVYHIGGQTVKTMTQKIKFHGVKNIMILCITNFETKYSLGAIFSLVSGSFQSKIQNNNNEEFRKPSFFTTLKAFFWLLGHLRYIIRKRKSINSKRKLSTGELIKMGLITN